jgi:phospholipid/cholesterol/gamma-HCH transport system substrate-binding protein
MENRAHALAAGLFVLLLGLALVTAIVWLRGDHVERIQHTLVAKGGVSGLGVKAPVKLRGVDVGTVESIEFDHADPRRILVTVVVDKAAPLTRGTTAKLGFQGVTGIAYVDLGDKGNDPRPLAALPPEQRQIELQPSLLDQIATSGPELLDRFNEAAKRLNTLLDTPNQERVARVLESAERATAQVGARAEELKPALAQLQPLLRHADQATQRAEASLARVDQLSGSAASLLDDVRGRVVVLDRLAQAAGRVEQAARSFEIGLVGVDAPPRPPLVEEFGRAARSVDRVIGQWGDEPRSLLFGRTPNAPGPGEPGFDAGAPR